MAKFKGYAFLAVATLAVFAFMGVQAYSANASVRTLTAEVKQLAADKEIKQAEVNALASELKLADFTLSRMLAERESIAAIRAQADAESERLRNELADAREQVALLRASQDEHVKNWANAFMPATAVRLLKYAAHSGNPDGNSNQNGLPDTAQRPVAQLSADYSF